MKVGDEVLIEIEGKYEVRVITQIASDSSSQDVKMIHKKEKPQAMSPKAFGMKKFKRGRK